MEKFLFRSVHNQDAEIVVVADDAFSAEYSLAQFVDRRDIVFVRRIDDMDEIVPSFPSRY